MCSVGIVGFILLPNGDVSICERLAYDSTFIMGNLNNQSIMEVWNSSAWDNVCYPVLDQYKGTDCYRCEAFEKCTLLKKRCYVRTMAVFGKLYGPEPSYPRIKQGNFF